MNKKSKTYAFGKTVGTVLGYSLVGASLGVIVLIPYLFLWSLNTLFSCGIPYTLETYTASLLLFFFARIVCLAQLHVLRGIKKKGCCGNCK